MFGFDLVVGGNSEETSGRGTFRSEKGGKYLFTFHRTFVLKVLFVQKSPSLPEKRAVLNQGRCPKTPERRAHLQKRLPRYLDVRCSNNNPIKPRGHGGRLGL